MSSWKCFAILCLLITAPTASAISAVPRSGSTNIRWQSTSSRRRPCRLRTQDHRDRRGGNRWRLCHPHQPAGRNLRRCDDGAQLQVTRPRGTRLSLHQDRRGSARAAGLSPIGRSGPRACLPLRSGLIIRMALRQRLAPMLFDDTDKAAPRHGVPAWWRRRSSPGAVAKQIGDGLPVHGFHSLSADTQPWHATIVRRDHTQLAARRCTRPTRYSARHSPCQKKSRCSQ